MCGAVISRLEEILTWSKALDSKRRDTEQPATCISAWTLGETGLEILISTILGVTNEPCATNDEIARRPRAIFPARVRAVIVVGLNVAVCSQTHQRLRIVIINTSFRRQQPKDLLLTRSLEHHYERLGMPRSQQH